MKITSMLSLCIIAFAALVACGTTLPPSELIAAREAYAKAYGGDANRLQPAKVYEAKKALDTAETKFMQEGDVQAVKDLAYVAQRKAQYAETAAALSIEEQKFADADKEMRAMTGRAIERYQQTVAEQQADLEKQRQQTEQARANAEKERVARIEAERKMNQALADLVKIASVKEEQRGMVITLTGSVLFASGKSELLPTAMVRLNEVAEALKAQTDRDMVVEGHTDNVGTVQSNLELAQRRAASVRDYLVSRGVDQNRIKAAGIGEARPIADNSTPEGRANNRRVEIIVSAPRESH